MTALEVRRDRVVRFHYELYDDGGKRLESSRDGDPVVALYGHGGLVPGVERALAGRTAGDRLEVRVPPEEGFGERREDRIRRVQKKRLASPKRLRPGMTVFLHTETGERHATVVKVGSSVVDVDFNHPFAGLTLAFRLEVVDVREAEPDEIAHGHAHGPGGHAHD